MATEQLLNKELLRHGEAVGIGMLCEILLSSSKKKNSTYLLLEKILKLYSLPTNLSEFNLKISKQKLSDYIYNAIFLDKKKVSKFPRYISLKTIYKPQVKEIENTGDILEIIKKFI